MPVPEERLYKPNRLNRWFAISSIVMTLSIFWMIYVDYARPWREFQDDYFVGKAAVAHLEYLDASRGERREALEEARRGYEHIAQTVNEQHGAEREKLRVEIEAADLAFRKANAPWSRASQVLEVTRDSYERALNEHGDDHPVTEQAHAQLLEEEALVEQLRKKKEHYEDLTKRLEGALKEIERPVSVAEKTLRELERVAEQALQKDQQYRGVLTDEGLLGGVPIVKTIMNMPLFDFTAPKNTPGRHQVNQLVLPAVRSKLNYLESYTTDRCTTCHVAIDDPEFSKDRLAGKLERAIPGINEERQRLGAQPVDYPPPPVLESTGQPLPADSVTEHWGELTEAQQDAHFTALLTLVNDYLELSGRKTISLQQPILAHPDLDLYVTPNSPHPMATMGCTVCHEGNPQETDFVQAAHTPPTHEVQKEWEEEYYISELGVPNITFESIQHYWDRPMRLPHHTEAGCAKCHEAITDIARFQGERKGARINLGRFLFTEVGCINCHDVDSLRDSRRVGPDLTHLASKLKPEFVQQWAYFPQKFRPSTRMPHFFLQENNREESANKFDTQPELRTQAEVAAMSKYLFAVSRDWEPIPKPEEVEGDAERGRLLFKEVGCLACHGNIAEFGETWITNDLVHREGFDEETARHRYKGMTNEERIRYAMDHFIDERETFLHPEKARFDPESDYTKPVFTRFAPELSGIGSKLSFDWLYSWLMDPPHYAADTKMPKLRLQPREAADIAEYLLTLKNDEFEQGVFEMDPSRTQMADGLIFSLLSSQRSERRSEAVMDDEGGELTGMIVAQLTASLGQQEAYDLVQPMTLEDKKLVYLGSKMIAHYGCYACHKIPGFEETTPPGTDLTLWGEKSITQLDFAFYDHAFHHMRHEREETFGFVYPPEAELLNHWSPLDDRTHEQISHTHTAFATHKMLNPRIWDREKIKRPYDKLKMPNFYFTEQEAEALTTYLLSRVSPRVDDVLSVDYGTELEGPIAAGRSLTRELNCVACHEIEDNAPTVQQYFRRKLGNKVAFDMVNAPPSLWGEGAKLQHHWFHRFLQHVEPLRPWLQVRMPSFNITGEQATTLVEYFAALSQRDAERLERQLAPVDEYVTQPRATHEVGDEQAGADWYDQELLKGAAAELRRFAVDRKLMRPFELDPLQTDADRFHQAHGKLLERVRFMRDVYDVEYPFVQPPTPVSSEERRERASRFFNDMGCLKCHVLGRMLPGPAENTDDFVQMYRLDGVRGEGDEAVAILNDRPYSIGSVIDGHTLVGAENIHYETGDIETKAYVEGPNPAGETERIMLQAASAPNLDLTHQRLRRGWVEKWMLEPQLIQPGTKMPQNFPNGKSPFEGDPDYPGTGLEHINLLVDYLYDAGTLGIRVPLPKIIVAEESEEFEEEERFFEE